VPSSLPHHLTAPPLPDKKALVLLKERVDKAADPKTELDAIVKRIKGNTNRERLPSSTFSTSPPPPMILDRYRMRIRMSLLH